MRQKLPLISIACTIGLTGLAIVFKDSIPFGVTLIVICIVLIVATVSWFFWESIPRFFTNQDDAVKAAQSIYRQASSTGGVIYATHIFPKDRDPNSDFAIKELKKAKPRINITFHRIILLDSKQEERNWLSTLFREIPAVVQNKFYVLSTYPLILPRITKSLLPRLNILLYQSPSGLICRTAIGLDRLVDEGNKVNFIITSRSNLVFRTLQKYFEHITGSHHFRPITSIDEYASTQQLSSSIEHGQDAVAKLSEFAEITSGISFIGLFGSMAKAALGLGPRYGIDETESDVDIIMIYDPVQHMDTASLRKKIQAAFYDQEYEIAWGPDLAPFYPYRVPNKVNIDIELFRVNDTFFEENLLLGHSIFSYFFPIYSLDGRGVSNVLKIPSKPLRYGERMKIVREDRQGFLMFKKRISEGAKHSDPRRLAAHITRNLVWAISGYWPRSPHDAASYLAEHPEWKNLTNLNKISTLLNAQQAGVQIDTHMHLNNLALLLDDAIKMTKSKS